MRGIPKFFNTKQDVLNVLAMPEAECPTVQKRKILEDLLKNLVDWFPTDNIDSVEAGIQDETHKVVANEPMEEGGQVTYTQYELKTNYGAPLYRLGFTVEEVQNLLASL